MTRPKTGQPKTEDELANKTQEANAELSKMLENGEIAKGFDDEEDSDDEKLAELREAKERGDFDELKEIVEENEQAPVWEAGTVRNKTDNTKMRVTENGDTETFTREEWEERRDARTRVWDRLARNGGVYVRVARWFNDADVNKVTTGRGFYAEKSGETEKAFQFTVGPNGGNHNAGTETVWVPKKAVQVYEIDD